jgi:neutral ceramidase
MSKEIVGSVKMLTRMSRRVLLVLPVLLMALGCAEVKIPIARYDVVKSPAGESYMAGAAKVDITPPPGYPMGGHSIGGRVSRGYWTRLYARAFYFQDTRGNRLILVSCDLFAIPAGLQRAVAHDLKIPPESLILSATHTHHGPAGYTSSSVFNFGGPLPGFDQELFRRLSGRIVAAIDEARANAHQPGEITVAMRSGFAPGLQRNRAIDAFFRNPSNRTDPLLRMSRAAGMSCPDDDAGNQCPRYQGVDPTLQVLEVLRGGQRIGLLVFSPFMPRPWITIAR